MVIITAAAVAGMVVASGLATMAVLARNEADIQRRQAEIEAETARQTTDFLVGLFAVSDPNEAKGNSITAREIMDKGAERIETELVTQPAIQATLMETMGTVYKSLALYPPAASLLESALKKRRDLYGDNHLEVARSADRLGEVREVLLQSPILQLFRQQLFSRVVPNLKRLGLLTPYVRAAFEEMRILHFEDLDPEEQDRALGIA